MRLRARLARLEHAAPRTAHAAGVDLSTLDPATRAAMAEAWADAQRCAVPAVGPWFVALLDRVSAAMASGGGLAALSGPDLEALVAAGDRMGRDGR